MTSRSKKWILFTILVVAAGYLIYRLSGSLGLSGFSAGKLWAAIRGANPFWLAASLILIYCCYALRSLRWQIFQRNLGHAKFWEIYPATLAGFSAVFLLGRAGEAIRPLLLAKRAKHPVADIFGIWVLERLFDFGCMGVIASAALLTLKVPNAVGDTASAVGHAKKYGMLLAAGVAGAFGFLVYLRVHGTALLERRLKAWRSGIPWKAKAANIVLSVISGIQTVRSWRDLLVSSICSAIHWALVLIVYYCVSQSFGGSLAALRFGDCTVLLAMTLVGSVFALPGVGGGTQAAAYFVYNQLFGIEKEIATAAAIVLWLVTFAGCAIAGIPLLIREGVSLGQLREMAQHEKEELKEIAAHGSVLPADPQERSGTRSKGEQAE